MTQPSIDVIAVGNAIVDVMAPCPDEKIEALGMTRGAMMLIDTEKANSLYGEMGPAREVSGGSAANTLAGVAALGAKCGFIGQVADDQLGEVFAHDIRAAGITFATPARAGDPPTARCLIFVSPDGQRTMNTYLGASQFCPQRRWMNTRSRMPRCFISKAIFGTLKSRALRCVKPLRQRGGRAAKWHSRCLMPS